MRKTLLALACAALNACAVHPVPSAAGTVIEEAGPRPTREAAVLAIQANMARTLRDADSVKQFAVVSGPDPFEAVTLGGAIERGWIVCAEFNATNGYGGFTGLQGHAYPMRFSGGQLTILSPIAWSGYSPRC